MSSGKLLKALEPQGDAWLRLPDFRRDIVKSVCLGKVFMTTEIRSSWNYSTSHRYQWADAFCFDLAQAKQHAEDRRTKGSRWQIKEYAACVFRGEHYAIWILEINADRSLSEFGEVTLSGMELKDISENFPPRRKNSVIQLVSLRSQVVATKGPFRSLDSDSSGGRRHLSWSSGDQVRRTPRGVTKVIENCARQVRGM